MPGSLGKAPMGRRCGQASSRAFRLRGDALSPQTVVGMPCHSPGLTANQPAAVTAAPQRPTGAPATPAPCSPQGQSPGLRQTTPLRTIHLVSWGLKKVTKSHCSYKCPHFPSSLALLPSKHIRTAGEAFGKSGETAAGKGSRFLVAWPMGSAFGKDTGPVFSKRMEQPHSLS